MTAAHGPCAASDPVRDAALDACARIVYLLDRAHADNRRVQAFVQAGDVVAALPDGELAARAAAQTLRELPGVGATIATVLADVAAGRSPRSLADLAAAPGPTTSSPAAAALRAALRGDCHTHTRASDGSASVRTMALTAAALGHEYLVVTDHSPRLTVAHGLDVARLDAQLDEIAALNAELAPFRVLRGCEVDILADGSLDHPDEVLARLDVVVASVHSRFRLDARAMTVRLVTALANPYVDILGHATGRKITEPQRPGYDFDHELVVAAAAKLDKAIELNCRPERLDPPRALLRLMRDAGATTAIDSDAHAPGQLEWQPYGCDRAAECGFDAAQVVNTWPVDDLLAWCGAHRRGA